MKDEDILKTIANELKMYGDFDNINYLIPQLGQAIENILAKYDKALSDLVKAEKEKNELKKEIEKFNKQLDLDYVDKNYIPISLVKETIEKIKKHKQEYEKKFKNEQDEEYYFDMNAIEHELLILEKLLEKEK